MLSHLVIPTEPSFSGGPQKLDRFCEKSHVGMGMPLRQAKRCILDYVGFPFFGLPGRMNDEISALSHIADLEKDPTFHFLW